MTHAIAASSDSGSVALGLVLYLVYVVAYFVPSIVAIARRGKANTGTIIVINFFLGWTVIGWIVALAMACRSVPQQQYGPPPGWQSPQQYGPPPGWQPPQPPP